MKNLDEFVDRYQGLSELTVSTTIVLSEDMRLLSCNKVGKSLLKNLGKEFSKGISLFDQIPEFGQKHPDFNLNSFQDQKILENWYQSRSYYLRFKFKKTEIEGLLVIVLFIVDDTKCAKTEERLNNSIKNYESLLNVLSHDLISPFNSIIGFLNLSIQYDTTEYLPTILDSSEKCLSQMQQVLEWRKTQIFKNKESDKRELYLHNIVEESFSIFKLVAEQKKVGLCNGVNRNIKVFANKTKLLSIISNFINNAIKFSHQYSLVYVNSHDQGDFVNLIFIDSGLGMNKEEMDLLFSLEKFSKKGTNNESGNGIGMISAYNLTKEMGGKIRVYSQKNKGTTIKLSIPK